MTRGLAAAVLTGLSLVAAACGSGAHAPRVAYEVAYTEATSGGGAALYLADGEAREVRRVSGEDGVARQPAWSPDGQQVAYAGCGRPEQERCSLYRADIDGGTPKGLGEGAWPQWSPDGQRLAFVKARGAGDELFVTDSMRDAPRLKTAGSDTDAGGGGVMQAGVSSWSPDGRELAVTRRLEGGEGSEVLLVRADGLRELRVGGDLEAATFAGWSPDGTSMLLFGREHGAGGGLFLMAGDGTGMRRLASVDAADAARAAWSPNGRQVAMTWGDGLAVVDVADGTTRQLADGECLGAGGLEWGSDASIWFTRGCDARGRALVELDVASRAERTFSASVIEFALRPR